MRIETITSAQNAKVRQLVLLGEKSRERAAAGLFVVEGQRELGHCLDAGYVPETLFVCGEVIARSREDSSVKASQSSGSSPEKTSGGHIAENIEGKDGLDSLVERASRLNPRLTLVQIPAFLYEKVAYRGSTEGIIAEVRSKRHSLEDLTLGENPLVVVLESVEKPGNLGAVLRSTDAAGASAVIVCDPLTDLGNPNLIRSSVGAVFTVPVAVCTTPEAIAFLKERKIQILSAQLQDSEWYYSTPMTGPTAIVLGTESTGLSREWRDAATSHIKIPMLGRLDSLNVSVSAAILLYEALRQRQEGADRPPYGQPKSENLLFE